MWTSIKISVTRIHIIQGTIERNPVERAMEGAGLRDVHANPQCAFFRVPGKEMMTTEITGTAREFLTDYAEADHCELKRSHRPFVFEICPRLVNYLKSK